MELHTQIPQLKVKDLLDEGAASLDLRLLAGEAGLTTAIAAPTIQKPGLALAGFFEYLHPGRVQILGRSEVEFLDGLPEERRRQVIAQLASSEPACFVVTRSLPAPAALHEEADRRGIALLGTDRLSGEAIEEFHRFLEERLAPFSSLHGVLVDVYGLGVLLLGDSGVGKSECALDLVVRGHRLVSDDLVQIRKIGNNLVGTGVDLTQYHMEVRGLGIINVKELFGIASVRQRKFVELIIRLDPWKEGHAYERLGIDERTEDILATPLPLVTIPVAPGRNLSVLIEVASRHHLMKLRGYNPAQELERKILQQIGQLSRGDGAPDGDGESGSGR
jgi:HPr kinase/phosphorylase